MPLNGTMMQYFHWYFPKDGSLWNQVSKEVSHLKELGITALWLPPATKGAAGADDVGYGVYDMYDLGEFDQKNTVATRYGTRQEYLDAVDAAHRESIEVYADVVFNHRGGADRTEWVKTVRVRPSDRRFVTSGEEWIEAFTEFFFPGRQGTYSDFVWRYHHFTGVDWAANIGESAIFKFLGLGKDWDAMVDDENGNYDYLMYADLDMNHPEVRTELSRWGRWFFETTRVDGFRLDAVKHIQFSFFRYWLDYMRKVSGRNLFAVGEYWNPCDVEDLHNYIRHTHGKMHLFDAPLHRNFHNASLAGRNFDMRRIFDRTLVKEQSALAVTLVENHDTQPLQALESPVEWWFKPLAYAMILLRQEGYPCVFYADFYGADYRDKGRDNNEYDIHLEPVPGLSLLIRARKALAFGPQHDYLDHPWLIGWTREGDLESTRNGVAVVLSTGDEGSKWMYVGLHHASEQFIDILSNRTEVVLVNADGWGNFPVNAGQVSVWGSIAAVRTAGFI